MRCPSPISIRNPKGTKPSDRLQVPCNQCGACRKNRRDSWTFRLKQEAQIALSAFFITLTYTDTDIPVTEFGEITLDKKDVQDFIKRVRKENEKYSDAKVRYYAVGEYGTVTDRPHYHVIIFNLHNKTVHRILELWKNGLIHVSPINDARIHYVTKYHVNPKPKDGSRQPEFAIMSRKPGIGLHYVKKNSKWHIENSYFHVINNGYKQNIPRYYKDKIFTPFEILDQSFKQKQQVKEKFKRECEALEETGVKSPESYIQQSNLHQSKKVLDKAQKGQSLF